MYIAAMYTYDGFPVREFLNSLNKKYTEGMRNGYIYKYFFFVIIHFPPLKN